MNTEVLIASHVDVAVHPFFAGRFQPELYKVPFYRDLINRWNCRFQELSQDSGSILVYFSILDSIKIANPREIQNEALELARIKTLQARLGNRMIAFEDGRFSACDFLLSRLAERHVICNPREVTILAYGEYMDGCVKLWGDRVKTLLGARGLNFDYRRADLCMTYEKARQIGREYYEVST